MLGHAGINNRDQIADCVERGWIVLSIEHRLCPGVNVLEGPMEDVKDVLGWVQNGGLAGVLKESENGNKVRVDEGRVMVMGTSSGGHLALSTMCEETASCSHRQQSKENIEHKTDEKFRPGHHPRHPSRSSTSMAQNPFPPPSGLSPSPRCPPPSTRLYRHPTSPPCMPKKQSS
ncbi:hypothetical protein IG631_16833 [Alternaria alternata]|nr:hypothetical protein IG631_16833 [Alternaria alternata]